MKRADRTEHGQPELVAMYEAAASVHHRFTDEGDYESANAQHEIVAATYRELRARGTAPDLAVLLSSEEPGVRLWAGAHALEFSPADGALVLEELARDPGIVGLTAATTLAAWREGTLRFP